MKSIKVLGLIIASLTIVTSLVSCGYKSQYKVPESTQTKEQIEERAQKLEKERLIRIAQVPAKEKAEKIEYQKARKIFDETRVTANVILVSSKNGKVTFKKDGVENTCIIMNSYIIGNQVMSFETRKYDNSILSNDTLDQVIKVPAKVFFTPHERDSKKLVCSGVILEKQQWLYSPETGLQ